MCAGHAVHKSCTKVDVRLPGKGNSNSHGARPVLCPCVRGARRAQVLQRGCCLGSRIEEMVFLRGIVWAQGNGATCRGLPVCVLGTPCKGPASGVHSEFIRGCRLVSRLRGVVFGGWVVHASWVRSCVCWARRAQVLQSGRREFKLPWRKAGPL